MHHGCGWDCQPHVLQELLNGGQAAVAEFRQEGPTFLNLLNKNPIALNSEQGLWIYPSQITLTPQKFLRFDPEFLLNNSKQDNNP